MRIYLLLGVQWHKVLQIYYSNLLNELEYLIESPGFHSLV